MFEKKKDIEEVKEQRLMDEWAEDEQEEAQKEKKRFFKKREKKEKTEKAPLTPAQKKKRRKRIIIGGVAVVLLAVTVLPKLFAPETYPIVSVVEASLGSVSQTVDGSGTVQSEETKTYFSPVSATVEDFSLQVGDTVEAGETLLTYNASELDNLYKEAELTGSAANYGYQDSIAKNNENVSEYNRSSAALDIINRQLDEEDDNLDHLNDRVREYTGYQGDSSNKIANLQAQISEKKAAVAAFDALSAEAKKLEESLKSMEANGQENTTEYQETKAALTKAQAEVEYLRTDAQNAQSSLPGLEQSLKDEQDNYNKIILKLDEYQGRLSDSQENKQKLETSKAKEEGIKDSSDAAMLSGAAKNQLAANNNLSSLQAQMTKEDIQEGKDGIKADFAGVVTKVAAVSGGPAAKGGELLTVASSEDVVVEMSITKYDLEKMAEGQKASVTMAGHEYEGSVTKLSRIAEKNDKGTPVVTAQVKIENPDENIYLGLEAKVSVQGNQAKDVLVVPTECINSGQDGDFCYVVQTDGTLAKKMIEKGLSSDDYTEIKSGLDFGDKVVSSGITAGIQEGTRVTAVEG